MFTCKYYGGCGWLLSSSAAVLRVFFLLIQLVDTGQELQLSAGLPWTPAHSGCRTTCGQCRCSPDYRRIQPYRSAPQRLATAWGHTWTGSWATSSKTCPSCSVGANAYLHLSEGKSPQLRPAPGDKRSASAHSSKYSCFFGFSALEVEVFHHEGGAHEDRVGKNFITWLVHVRAQKRETHMQIIQSSCRFEWFPVRLIIWELEDRNKPFM